MPNNITTLDMLTWSTARNYGLRRQKRPRPIEVHTQETYEQEVILIIYIYISLKPPLSELQLSEHWIIPALRLGPGVYAYVNRQPRLSEHFFLVPASSNNRGCPIHTHTHTHTHTYQIL